MRKRIIAFITVLALAISAMGMTAFAAETEGTVSEETTYTLSAGTYKATTTADNGTVYTYTVELDEDGNYTYLVEFTMGGTVYPNTESGIYAVENSTATFTAVTSEIKEGEVYTIELTANDSFTWTRLASYFAVMSGKTADIAFAKDGAENDTTTGDNSTEGTTPDTDDDTTTDYTETVAGLESGKYAVDLTWVPFMDAMLDPVLEIDAEKGTFKVYNAATPETLKGNGTITAGETTGEYTLAYETAEGEEAKETTFTYDAENDTVAFTSALIYGASSFNNIDETTGEFVPYVATLMKDTADEEAGKDENATDEEAGKDENTTDEETSKDENTTDEETGKDDVVTDKNTAPDTADNSPVAFYAIAALAALGAAVVFTKKRNA